MKFLLDGAEYFARFVGCIDWVKQDATSKHTYIRLAFWEFDPDMYVSPHKTMADVLIEAATAGARVEILLWKPDKPSSVDTKVFGLANFVVEVDKHASEAVERFAKHPNITVYLQKHEQWLASYHEKVAIFSVAGLLQVLVGGLNMTNDYYDSTDHWGAHPIPHVETKRRSKEDPPHTCHESAVWLQGPATVHIEAHWLNRFVLFIRSADAATKRRYAFDNLARGTLLQTTPPQQAYPSGGDYASNVEITVATTGPEKDTQDVRKLLCHRISEANEYVYIENFTFSDPTLVDAVSARLRSKSSLSFCGVIPESIIASQPEVRLAYVKMICHGCSGDAGLSALETKSKTVQRHGHGRMAVGSLPTGYVDDVLLRKVLGISIENQGWFDPHEQLTLSEVEDFSYRCDHENHDTDQCTLVPRAAFYSPTRYWTARDFEQSCRVYIHSKLMLIDDQHTIIGSANFNYRSMNYDGELVVDISGREFARHVKQRILEHFGVPNDRLEKGLARALWWNSVHYSRDGKEELSPAGKQILRAQSAATGTQVKLVFRRPCDVDPGGKK